MGHSERRRNTRIILSQLKEVCRREGDGLGMGAIEQTEAKLGEYVEEVSDVYMGNGPEE